MARYGKGRSTPYASDYNNTSYGKQTSDYGSWERVATGTRYGRNNSTATIYEMRWKAAPTPKAAPAPAPAPAPTPAPAATPTNNYQSQIASLTARIADQQAKYELQIKDYTNKQAAAAEARKTTEAGYQNKLSSMESSYLENLKNTKTQYATQAESRQAEYERMMLDAQSQYDQRTKDALAGYNTQLQTTKTDLENSYLNNLQIQQDKYTEQSKNTRTLLESSFEKTLQDARSQYETQSAARQSQYEAQYLTATNAADKKFTDREAQYTTQSAATKAAYDKQTQELSDRDAERAAAQKSYLENLRIQQDSRLSQMALDAKTRADDLALGQRTYQQNQSRSNQLGDLQIGNAGGGPKIGGTQGFKRRKLQVNPATANALSGILGGSSATSSTNTLNV